MMENYSSQTVSDESNSQKRKKPGFINSVFKTGNVVVIYGAMDCGKTNFACFLMEKALSRGYHCFTNIGFFKDENIRKAIMNNNLKNNVPYIKKTT